MAQMFEWILTEDMKVRRLIELLTRWSKKEETSKTMGFGVSPFWGSPWFQAVVMFLMFVGMATWLRELRGPVAYWLVAALAAASTGGVAWFMSRNYIKQGYRDGRDQVLQEVRAWSTASGAAMGLQMRAFSARVWRTPSLLVDGVGFWVDNGSTDIAELIRADRGGDHLALDPAGLWPPPFLGLEPRPGDFEVLLLAYADLRRKLKRAVAEEALYVGATIKQVSPKDRGRSKAVLFTLAQERAEILRLMCGQIAERLEVSLKAAADSGILEGLDAERDAAVQADGNAEFHDFEGVWKDTDEGDDALFNEALRLLTTVKRAAAESRRRRGEQGAAEVVISSAVSSAPSTDGDDGEPNAQPTGPDSGADTADTGASPGGDDDVEAETATSGDEVVDTTDAAGTPAAVDEAGQGSK